MEVRIYQDMLSLTTSIAFLKKDHNGNDLIAKPMELVFEPLDETQHVEPTLKLDRREANEFLQELSTALNEAGYRSTSIEGYKSEIAATNRHLDDMRKLVFEGKT